MHAETLRERGTKKLPFAECSVVKVKTENRDRRRLPSQFKVLTSKFFEIVWDDLGKDKSEK